MNTYKLIPSLLITLLLSSPAMAFWGERGCHHNCAETPTEVSNESRSDSRSDSTANANGGAGGQSSSDLRSDIDVSSSNSSTGGTGVSYSGSNSQSGSSTGEVNSENTASNQASVQGGDIQITHEYEAVANAVRLNLAHCSDGVGASTKSGSINTGGVNYICEASRAMGLILTTIPRETPEEVAATLEQAKDIKEDVYWYMKIRKYTAAIGAALRDTWPIFALLVWI